MFDAAQLDAEILSAVQKVWNAEKRPLLLSQLGLGALSEVAKAFVSDHSVSLKRHVRQRLSGQVRFVPMPRQGGGLAPGPATDEWSDVQLEQAYANAASPPSHRPRRPRFVREVWRAFADPLSEGTMRALDPNARPPSVRQLATGESLLPGEIAISAHETAISDAPDGGVTARAVEQAILAWCAESGLDAINLIVPQPQSAGVDAKAARPARTHGIASSSTDFAEVLRSIPRDQLARVSVPGDVLLAIIERLTGR